MPAYPIIQRPVDQENKLAPSTRFKFWDSQTNTPSLPTSASIPLHLHLFLLMTMHHPHYFLLIPIIIGLRCLSADTINLFDDNEALMTANDDIFNSLTDDALTSPSNDADESLLLSSLDDSSNFPYLQELSEGDRHSGSDHDSDFITPSTSPPVLLSLDPEYPSSSEFHDDPPGEDFGPECEYPRLAACCFGRNWRTCTWYDSWREWCGNVENVVCCEQVTAKGQGHNCQDVQSWPGVLRDQLLDILRMPVLPEGLPGGLIPEGIWGGNG